LLIVLNSKKKESVFTSCETDSSIKNFKLFLQTHNKNRTIEIYAIVIRKSEEIIDPLNYGIDVKAKSKELKR